MKKPADIFDRDLDWRTLTRIWERPSPDLVFVVGRRRIGKSYLLTRFTREAGGIYYQATRRTEAEQLASLSRVVGEHFDDAALRSGVGFPDWEALFAYLIQRTAGKRFVLTLDEFPYLSTAAPALPSILQSLWDHSLTKTGFKLVLSGSHLTAMRQLEAADQPLYGRRTARLLVQPFDCRDACAFFPGYSAQDRLRAFAIFGGLPGHLTLIDPARPLAENVAEQLLSPAGRLVDEAQHMLDAFFPDPTVPYSIIEAVARGEHTWNGISKRVGRVGGGLHRSLQWLEQMQTLTRVVPVTERSPEKSKRAIYRITDPYVAFWHHFVSPLVSSGALSITPAERLWTRIVAPGLDAFMGPAFEEICRSFVLRGSGLDFEAARLGEWWDAGSQNQVDLVAEDGHGTVLLGECKWGAADPEDLRKLHQRADLLLRELSGVRKVQLAIFSGRGKPSRALRTALDASHAWFFGPDALVPC